MKKIIFAIFTALIIFPSVVRAESAENITKRRPEKAVEIQEIRQDLRDKAQELRSDVAQMHGNRLEKRFTFYYTRLTNIITRFEKRLDILTSEGKDVTSVKAKLDLAKAKLEEAKLKGEAAVAAFRAIDPAKFSEQKTEAFAARDLATAARKLFMEAFTLLKDALRALKVISKPALPAASAAVQNAK